MVSLFTSYQKSTNCLEIKLRSINPFGHKFYFKYLNNFIFCNCFLTVTKTIPLQKFYFSWAGVWGASSSPTPPTHFENNCPYVTLISCVHSKLQCFDKLDRMLTKWCAYFKWTACIRLTIRISPVTLNTVSFC